jgi:hypothetical protein
MTSISNLTPVSPVALPWTYVANGGQAYSLSSAQGAGCVDTVTPLTPNALGTFNVKGVPAYPTQAYGVIAQADQQYGPVVIACQSLVNQINSGVSSSAGVPSQFPNYFGDILGTNAFVNDVAGAFIIVVVIVAALWLIEKALKGKRRG